MRFKLILMFLITVLSGHAWAVAELEELKSYPLNSSDNVITKTGVEFDSAQSSDGNGSLKIKVETPTIIKLFDTGDIDIDNANQVDIQGRFKNRKCGRTCVFADVVCV